MLYLSYGMNTNVEEMSIRCPNAISLGKCSLDDHRLVFCGHADVEDTGSSTVTTKLGGGFKDDPAARAEFLSIARMGK